MRLSYLDRLLRRASRENKEKFLIAWNRGLGDIPLILYALVHRIRYFIPRASITFLTRTDLALGFEMLDNVHVLPCPHWKRGHLFDVDQSLAIHQLTLEHYDVFLETIDLDRWFQWQIGVLTPKLKWEKKWDALSDRYCLDREKTYIGVHVNTETARYYNYEKNWPLDRWQALFAQICKWKNTALILFGREKKPFFCANNIIDLRGETSIFDVLSVIKNHCHSLIAPDSGILSLIYYIEAHFPLLIVSLWADPRRGILRQNVASPNRKLEHLPIVETRRDISSISCRRVYETLLGKTS